MTVRLIHDGFAVNSCPCKAQFIRRGGSYPPAKQRYGKVYPLRCIGAVARRRFAPSTASPCLLSAADHACFGCSLVNAFATIPLRFITEVDRAYHAPFATNRLRVRACGASSQQTSNRLRQPQFIHLIRLTAYTLRCASLQWCRRASSRASPSLLLKEKANIEASPRGGAEPSARSARCSKAEARVEQGAEGSANDALRPCETIQLAAKQTDEVFGSVDSTEGESSQM